MSGVDNRIVSMTFDNESFERNLAATVRSLDKLNESITFVGAQNGFRDLSKSAEDFNISGIADGIDNISSRFSALGAIGFSVIQKLTQSAIEFASQTAGNILDPLLGGGKKRAENIEQAKFMLRGLGMDIEATMASAKSAVLGTAYGLDSAAKAAAQLGGSGLKAGDEMTGALRGIAGLASMTGASYDEMADIFVSAAGQGKVSGMEFQRIGQRGVNAAAKLAEVWGTTEAEVRRMASEGEISFEMFAKGMDDAFGEHSQKANETYAGSLGNLRTAFSRLGASFFGPSLEQQRDLFNALTPAVDKVHEALKPFINSIIGLKRIGIDNMIARINGLKFENFGIGMDKLSHAVGRAFFAMNQVMTMLKEAFREVFPPSSTSKFVSITSAIAKFAHTLIMNRETLLKLKAVFVAFFSAISIGWAIVKGITTVFFALAKGIWSVISPLLGLVTGNVGFIKSLQETLVTGGKIKLFFDILAAAVQLPFKALVSVTKAVVEFINGLSLFDRVKDKVQEPGKELKSTAEFAQKVVDVFKNILDTIGGILIGIGDVFSNIFGSIGDAISAILTGDFDTIIEVIKTGLIGGILVVLTKFLIGGLKVDLGLGELVGKIGDTFDALTGYLGTMQNKVRADMIFRIAEAVALLALSAIALSFVNPKDLKRSLAAIGAGLLALTAIMVTMSAMSQGTGALKILAMGLALLFLAAAVTLLVIPILILSRMDTGALIKGMGAVAAGILVMAGALRLIGDNRESLLKAGLSMVFMAFAMILLARAIKAFQDMALIDIAVGMITVGIGLFLLTEAMNALPENLEKKGLGLLLVAISLQGLARAVQKFADIDTGDLVKGFLAIHIGMRLISSAMKSFPPDMERKSIDLVIVAGALYVMGMALERIGNIPFTDLVKGLGALWVTLGLVVAAVTALEAVQGGAYALAAAAAGLVLFAMAVERMGSIDLGNMIQGIAGLAGVLAVLALASLLAPGLGILGLALLAIGAGLFLIGAGAALAGTGLRLMAEYGGDAVNIMAESLREFIRQLPSFISAMVVGVIRAADEIASELPALMDSIQKIIVTVLDAIIEIAPKLAEALNALVTMALGVFNDRLPEFIAAGFALVLGLLTGLRDNIGEFTTVVLEIITGFLDALTEGMPEFVSSVIEFFATAIEEIAFGLGELIPELMVGVGISFMQGLWQGITDQFAKIGIDLQGIISDIIGFFTSGFGIFSPSTVMADIGVNIIKGLLNGLISMVKFVFEWFIQLPIDILLWIGDMLIHLVPKGLDLLVGLLKGIGDGVIAVMKWFIQLPLNILTWIGNALRLLVDKGFNFLKGLLGGILEGAKAVVSWFLALPQMILDFFIDAGTWLVGAGEDIVQGLINGVDGRSGAIKDLMFRLATSTSSQFGGALGIRSPSTVFYAFGENVVKGLALGIDKNTSAENSAGNLAKRVNNQFQEALSKIPVALSGMDDFNPTITPVLDLSTLQAGAKGISGIMGNSAVAADVSLSNARYISAISSTRPDDGTIDLEKRSGGVVFNQNIYAPRELSANDIYRNTKSQIAVAKEELKI